MAEKESSYCPPGTEIGLISDYVPKGNYDRIDNLQFYTVGKGEKAIIVIHDIFGVKSGRTHLICDQIANLGYLVIMPNLFADDGMVIKDLGLLNMFSLLKRVKSHTWDKLEEHFTKRIYPYLDSKEIKMIGMLGFGWGTYVIFNACKNERISAAVSFHPILTRSKESAKELAQGVKCPQMLLSASDDDAKVQEGGEVEQILKEKLGDKAVFQTFQEMKLGWVNQGNQANPNIKRDVRQAIGLGFGFLEKYV